MHAGHQGLVHREAPKVEKRHLENRALRGFRDAPAVSVGGGFVRLPDGYMRFLHDLPLHSTYRFLNPADL
jgi:hypothetical protein